MRRLAIAFLTFSFLFLGASAAWAPCGISGSVFCDVNQNGIIDEGDTPLSGIEILLDGSPSLVRIFTDENGFYSAIEHEICGVNTVSLDTSLLPNDIIFIDPSTNSAAYSYGATINWLIDSESCHPVAEENCWLTAGGVKFEPIPSMRMATGGPKDSVGGVAYPSCSPFPSNGGQWNHLAHSLKMHLLGKDITVIRCGNVPGIDPGSESPVCPVNFIEFEGTGVVKGIHGNKMEDLPVSFFVRAEDRNEPGNEQALNSNDGEDIDRYFLSVVDGDGNVVFQVDNGIGEPLTITGGNFQIHCTSCD